MPLAQAEQIRSRIAERFERVLSALRVQVSCTDGNAEAVEQLRGQPLELLKAKLTDATLAHLGHNVGATDASGVTRRVLAKMRGGRRSKDANGPSIK